MPPIEIDFDLLAFEQAPVGLVLTELRIIKSCNQTFADMFGFPKIELLGQSFLMLYASRQEFEDMRDIGIQPLKEKGIYSDERIIQHREGNRFWCRFRAHTLTPEDPLERTILSFAVISDLIPNVTLTPRERQVVLFLSRGLTSKETAREMGISPRTVEDFRARLLKKFRVRNTAELLAHLTVVEH